jgi:2-phosphosulfolactate phosphatase
MPRSVVIDCFPESAVRYREGHAVVVIDVVRATTTAITAVALGRRCLPVVTPDAAYSLAGRLADPLLVGEVNGIMPTGFDINNSPAALVKRKDLHRPVILLSSSGTRLLQTAACCEVAFLACLRNFTSLATHLASNFADVAVIGAGTRGEFREEDQMCCAWIADRLFEFGYRAGNEATDTIAARWRGCRADAWTQGNSAAYLRRSQQLDDLDFILHHIDDLQAVFTLRDGEVVCEPPAKVHPAAESELVYD